MTAEEIYGKLDKRQREQVLAGLAGLAPSRNFDSVVNELKRKYKVRDLTPEERLQQEADVYNNTQGMFDKEGGYNCDICKNKGWISYVEDGYIVDRECECMRVRKAILNMKNSGLEELVKTCTFDNFIVTEPWQEVVKNTAVEYAKTADNPQEWLFIGGSSGSGKTHICTAICREFLLKGLSVKYMLWRDESTRLKALVNDERYEKIIAKIKRVDVLYIDDLFKTSNGDVSELPTPADIRLAFEILDYRRNKGLKTLISNERYIMELVNLDEALGSRIAQMCQNYTLNIKRDRKKNYRLKKLGEMI